MNKIKIIDLINMISRGEKVPKKVLYDENEYSFVRRNRPFAKYIREPFDARVPYYLFTDILSIYDEVEPLEEPKGIPEKLESYISCGWNGTCKDLKREELFEDLKKMGSKINEIIDTLEMLNDKIK